MTTNTITVTMRNGSTKSVESPHSDYDIGAVLQRYLSEEKLPRTKSNGDESFAASLSRSYDEHGLSDKQTAWAHILVVGADTPREEAAAVATLPRIRQMVEQASEAGLAYPKINLTTEGGQKVRLSRAGSRSRSPGVINITDGRPYGDNTFFGRIDLEGGLHPTRAMTDEVQDFLAAFDADPASQATAYGQRTGNCCFCRRDLSTAESVAVGYGPICADRYGLPWGETRISSTVVVGAGNSEGGGVDAN